MKTSLGSGPENSDANTDHRIFVLLLAAVFFWLGRRQAVQARQAGIPLHSLPHFYGSFAALAAGLPALLLLAVMAIGDDILFRQMVTTFYPADLAARPGFNEQIVLAQIENLVAGVDFGAARSWARRRQRPGRAGSRSRPS